MSGLPLYQSASTRVKWQEHLITVDGKVKILQQDRPLLGVCMQEEDLKEDKVQGQGHAAKDLPPDQEKRNVESGNARNGYAF